jgi:hypothetical protein
MNVFELRERLISDYSSYIRSFNPHPGRASRRTCRFLSRSGLAMARSVDPAKSCIPIRRHDRRPRQGQPPAPGVQQSVPCSKGQREWQAARIAPSPIHLLKLKRQCQHLRGARVAPSASYQCHRRFARLLHTLDLPHCRPQLELHLEQTARCHYFPITSIESCLTAAVRKPTVTSPLRPS